VKREAISKSLRFEVLKRDSFKCQYCGRSAPEALLQIDHIEPVSKGGGSDITNLITACGDCNSGKSDRRLNDSTVIEKKKSQLDELQERREQLEMMMAWHQGLLDITADAVEQIAEYWSGLTPGFAVTEPGKQSIRKWMKKYSVSELLESANRAAAGYLHINTDGTPTAESVNHAFSMIPKICAIEREVVAKPELKDLFSIRALLRKRMERQYFENSEALRLLDSAYSWGIRVPELRQIALSAYSWRDFEGGIVDAIYARRRRNSQ
jgi:hypothetical protein